MIPPEFRERQEMKKLLRVTNEKQQTIDKKEDLRKFAILKRFKVGLEERLSKLS